MHYVESGLFFFNRRDLRGYSAFASNKFLNFDTRYSIEPLGT